MLLLNIESLKKVMSKVSQSPVVTFCLLCGTFSSSIAHAHYLTTTGISITRSILYWETGEPLSHNIFLRAFGYIVIPAERGEEKAGGEERGSAPSSD